VALSRFLSRGKENVMMNTARTGILLVVLAQGLAGCGESRGPTGPTASSSSSEPSPQPSPQPVPPASPIQPRVTSITPDTGSTGGGAWGAITGADFQPGVVVSIGDGPTKSALVQDSKTILFWTAPHASGTVDVAVTNPGGLTSRLAGGYTFAPPESFDFNGEWIAHAGPDYDIEMGLAILNDALVSVSCGGTSVALSIPVHVRGGEFSAADEHGVIVSGRVVSPVNALGTINVPGCASTTWWADKSGAAHSAGVR
jgi:hypothetical protein